MRFIRLSKRQILVFISFLALILIFQNCKQSQLDTIDTNNAASVAAVPAANFSFDKAVVDQPPVNLAMIPGASLNETVIIDEDKLAEVLGNPSGDQVASQKVGAEEVSFFWRNESNGEIVSEGLNLLVENLQSEDSGRYQLYARVRGEEYKVNYAFVDVNVNASNQVANNSLPAPTISAKILSISQSAQIILVNINHSKPGLVRSIDWQFGNIVVIKAVKDLRSAVVQHHSSAGNQTVRATVRLQDNSTHNLSVQIPVNDPALTSCLANNTCPKVCSENRITDLVDNSGVKIERCIADGLKYAPALIFCNNIQSVYSAAEQKCIGGEAPPLCSGGKHCGGSSEEAPPVCAGGGVGCLPPASTASTASTGSTPVSTGAKCKKGITIDSTKCSIATNVVGGAWVPHIYTVLMGDVPHNGYILYKNPSFPKKQCCFRCNNGTVKYIKTNNNGDSCN